jgi:hypothetical protein
VFGPNVTLYGVQALYSLSATLDSIANTVSFNVSISLRATVLYTPANGSAVASPVFSLVSLFF